MHAVISRPTWVLAVAVLAVLSAGISTPAGAQGGGSGLPEHAPDQLSPEQDNADPAHNDCGGRQVSEAGSEIHRKLIDGPRQPGTDELAFVSGVCIYLPPGYRTSGLRYPVLYLLHGAFGWQDDWVVQGDMQAIMDRVRGDDPSKDMIVVMPDGSYNATWVDNADGTLANETYVFDHVVPYVDRYFRTIPDRRGRSMSGLSNGGAGTLRMAAHHPDFFTVVTAMSAALPVNTAADRTSAVEVHNDPTEMAANLNEVDLALVWGLTCGTPEECQTYGFGYGFENACCSNEVYRAKLEAVRTRPYTYEATDGAHDWYFWQRWLEFTHGEFLRDHLADPELPGPPEPPSAPPSEFAFRSIDDVVEIYDHTFVNDPARGTEFLTLEQVTAGGMTLRGSGTVTVTTPARYAPGATVGVTGTGAEDGPVVADDEGRLTFAVDLGPARDGSLPPDLADATATSRTVSMASSGSLEHAYLENARGEYHYYLYTPAGYDPSTPTPLQVVIHGANTVALEQVMANEHHPVADRERFMVLYPDFVNEADTKPDGGESTPLSLAGSHPARLWDSNDLTSRHSGQGDAAAIVAMLDQVAATRNLDRDRVYVSGMSSGGMMTSLLIGLYPDVFAAAGIIASCGFTAAACFATGVPGMDEVTARSALAAMGEHARAMPFMQMQGQQDTTISPSAADFTTRQWLMTNNLAAGGASTTDGPYPLTPTGSVDGAEPEGHTWTVESYRDEDGCLVAEHHKIHEMAHFWPGGTDDATWAEWTDHRAPSGAEATWAFFERFTLDGPTEAAC